MTCNSVLILENLFSILIMMAKKEEKKDEEVETTNMNVPAYYVI